MKSKAIYRVENLVHRYDRSVVLQIESLVLPPGSIIGLSGPNGSGKTTLLKILGCIEKPTRGQIWFKGKPAFPFAPDVRFNVSYLPQSQHLMSRNVIDNITYGLRIRKDPGDHYQKACEALEMVGLSGETFSRKKWYALSGGEAQRVALAARLVLRPQVLLLDEPTANVDENSSRLIREASLLARDRWNTTLIIASHDQEWLGAVCDEMLFLFQGRLTRSSRHSILFSPFQKNGQGVWVKCLGDGQELVLSPPPSRQAAGLIPSSRITLYPLSTEKKPEAHLVSGKVTHLCLEKYRQTVVATVRGGRYQFYVDLKTKQEADHRFYPGREVLLHIPPQAIQWHAS